MNQNTINPEVEFPKVEKMLYDLAWKFSQQYPIPFEDAKSQAYWGFMRACVTYKPGRKTKFSSWVYYAAWCWLKTLVMERSACPLSFVEIEEDLLGAAPSLTSESLELIDDLSEDAKTMVQLIVETPKDLLDGAPMTVRQLMKRVKEYMTTKHGRTVAQVNTAHKELQTRFASAWAS